MARRRVQSHSREGRPALRVLDLQDPGLSAQGKPDEGRGMTKVIHTIENDDEWRPTTLATMAKTQIEVQELEAIQAEKQKARVSAEAARVERVKARKASEAARKQAAREKVQRPAPVSPRGQARYREENPPEKPPAKLPLAMSIRPPEGSLVRFCGDCGKPLEKAAYCPECWDKRMAPYR